MNVNLESHPEFVEAVKRLGEAKNEQAHVVARITEIYAELISRQPPTLIDRATQWLARGESTNYATSTGLREELGRLYDQKAVLTQAVALQEGVVDRVRQRLSEQIVSEIKPDHVALVRTIARLVAELGQANQAEIAFRNGLTERGVRFSAWIRPLAFFQAGDIGEEYSACNLYLQEVREYCPEAIDRPSKREQGKSLTVKGEEK